MTQNSFEKQKINKLLLFSFPKALEATKWCPQIWLSRIVLKIRKQRNPKFLKLDFGSCFKFETGWNEELEGIQE